MKFESLDAIIWFHWGYTTLGASWPSTSGTSGSVGGKPRWPSAKDWLGPGAPGGDCGLGAGRGSVLGGAVAGRHAWLPATARIKSALRTGIIAREGSGPVWGVGGKARRDTTL